MKHPITPFPWHIGGTFKPDGDDPRTSIWGPPAPGMQSGNCVASKVRPADARLIITLAVKATASPPRKYTAEDYERVIAEGGNVWSTLERLRDMVREARGG